MLARRKRSAHRKRARARRCHILSRGHTQCSRRSSLGARSPGRVWISFFSTGTPQHVKITSALEPWLGGGAMLAGLVSWGVVLGLLGS
jgi:hypothetical protein